MKILLLEDDPGDQFLTTKSLSDSSHSIEFQCEAQLQDALNRPDLGEFDVILADLSLPDCSGLQSVEALHQAVPQTTIIVLTGTASVELGVEAIRLGAQDYIVKDLLSRELLSRSIRHSMERQAMQIANDKLLAELRESKLALEKKNEKLENVCEAAQQSVDNVSHEFRTPLTVIMEYSSIIRDGIVGEVNDEQRRLLNVISDRGNDLNNMVDDMLDISRLESGLMGVSRGAFAIADVISHVLPSLERKADVRGARVDVEVPEDLPDVFCDDEKVGRVIVNLITNAIKFAGDPGHVRLWVEQPSDDEIEVFVGDNGDGIPEDRLQEIFNRFTQVHSELRSSTKGFGLGLNIAQDLVRLNFGKMNVASQAGKGSTFSFTIPVADQAVVLARYLSWLGYQEDAPKTVSAVEIRCEDADAWAEIDAFLRYVLRPNDLVFQRDRNEWVLMVNAPSVEVETFLNRLRQEHDFQSRNRPLGPLAKIDIDVTASWQLPVDCHQLLNHITQDAEALCHV